MFDEEEDRGDVEFWRVFGYTMRWAAVEGGEGRRRGEVPLHDDALAKI